MQKKREELHYHCILAGNVQYCPMDDGDTNPCRRCGACCLPGIYSLMKDEDLRRWKEEGRTDILRVIDQAKPLWAGDHIIYAGGDNSEKGCVFLEISDGLATCAIYEARPLVCRNFKPASSLLCPLWNG